MPVDELVDMLASLSIYPGRGAEQGNSKKLVYDEKGEIANRHFFEILLSLCLG